MVTDVDAFGATADGKAISIFARSRSVPGRNVAAAPSPATDATFALEFIRTVSVRPAVPPTLVALSVATTLITRSVCCTFALTSNELTCQMTGAVVCAPAYAQTQSNRRRERNVFIFVVFFVLLCGSNSRRAAPQLGDTADHERQLFEP